MAPEGFARTATKRGDEVAEAVGARTIGVGAGARTIGGAASARSAGSLLVVVLVVLVVLVEIGARCCCMRVTEGEALEWTPRVASRRTGGAAGV